MTTFLVFVTLVMLFAALALIARISEQTTGFKEGKYDYTAQSKLNGYFMLITLAILLIGTAVCFKVLAPLMLPQAASIHGVRTDFLFDTTLIIILIAYVITNALLFYFAYRYNESHGHEAYYYPHNNTLEIVWTAVPAIVLTALIAMGMYEWFRMFDVNSRDKNMMVVETTGKQFNWVVRYSGKDGKFGERIIDKEHISPSNELGINFNDAKSHDDFFADKIYLVKNKPVLMKLGAQDVLHSFFLPHFRVKMDCVPGIPTEFYFTPTITTKEMQQYLSKEPWWQATNPETGEPRWKSFKYELACAELCGKSHYGMQKEVVVVEQPEYDEWLAKQTPIYQPKPAPTESASTALENNGSVPKLTASLEKK